MTRQQRADFTGTCDRCDGIIRPGDAIARCAGGWVHAGCASGGDDE